MLLAIHQKAYKSTTHLGLTQEQPKSIEENITQRHWEPHNGVEDGPQTPYSFYTYRTYQPQ